MRFSIFTIISLTALVAASPIAHGTPEANVVERQPAAVGDSAQQASAPAREARATIDERDTIKLTVNQVVAVQTVATLAAAGKITGGVLSLAGGIIGGILNAGKNVVLTAEQAAAIAVCSTLNTAGKITTAPVTLTVSEYAAVQVVTNLYTTLRL